MTELMQAVSLWNLLFWTIVFVALICCSAVEDFAAAIVIIISSVAVGVIVFDNNIIGWIGANSGLFAGLLVAYAAAGVCWSFFKWDRFCAEKAQESKKEIADLNSRKEENKSQVDQDYIARRIESFKTPPVALEFKGKFTSWILLWPFSVLVFILDDFVDWLRDAFLRMFGKVYEVIAARHYKDI